MLCAKCGNDMDPGAERDLCDDCASCWDCGRTATEADVEHGQCPDCWARDMREEMRADRSLGSW